MSLAELMDGITILSENEICQAPTAIVVACITASCIIVILTAILTKEDSPARYIIAPICVLMSCAILHAKREPTGQYEYKVTIDDTVSLTEFYEKYEIVDLEGKIYTIKLKEDE